MRDDIASAKAQMHAKLVAGREIKQLPSLLAEGETVRRLASGRYKDHVGLLVLTDRRLLFFVDEHFGRKHTEDFPLDKVSSIQWDSGHAQGTLTVFASSNTAEIKNVLRQDGEEIARLIRARLSGGSAAVGAGTAAATSAPDLPPNPASSPDLIEQLRRLGELRDAGIVTDDEFEAKKAEMLRRI